jgi:antitoxin component YwqK of YwqJK toxin-antitoxin module
MSVTKRKYYDNGQLRWETPFVNGQAHGIERCRYPNGKLAWETPWVNDQRHGIARDWHENGQLWFEIAFVNDQRHGIARWWKEDGKLSRIEKFHRGRRFINLEFDPIPSDAKMELDLTTNEMSYE